MDGKMLLSINIFPDIVVVILKYKKKLTSYENQYSFVAVLEKWELMCVREVALWNTVSWNVSCSVVFHRSSVLIPL